LIALAGSFFFALFNVTTRILRGTPDVTLVATQTIGALIAGAALVPFAWTGPSARDLALLALLGVVALAAHALENRSLKLAPASVVVPYQYSLIVWAVLFGYFVFGDVPDTMLIVGAAIIVAAGIFIFLREQAAGERPPPPEAHA
jgi:drug/metabolite transporter (DMT)-like permease